MNTLIIDALILRISPKAPSTPAHHCECGRKLEPLPADDTLYCPECEPSRELGNVVDDDLTVVNYCEGCV